MRIEVNITNPVNIDVLNLKMKYDDGFIAYLNGVKIEEANALAGPVWNSGATGSHSDSEAVQFVNFDVSAFAGNLVVGTNVLAIHGLNNGVGSSDFLIVPELEVGESTVASGLQLNQSTFINARTQAGNEWSAPSSAYFFIDTVPADASKMDPYGDPYDPFFQPPNAPPPIPFLVTYLNADSGWKTDLAELDGAQFIQMRITMTSNVESSVSPT